MSMNDYAMDIAEDIISDTYKKVSEGEITFDDTGTDNAFDISKIFEFLLNKKNFKSEDLNHDFQNYFFIFNFVI